MINRIKDVSAVLSQEYGNVLLFNTLTGLRPDETQKAPFLIKTKEDKYIGKNKGIIKKYQFSKLSRQAKDAY